LKPSQSVSPLPSPIPLITVPDPNTKALQEAQAQPALSHDRSPSKARLARLWLHKQEQLARIARPCTSILRLNLKQPFVVVGPSLAKKILTKRHSDATAVSPRKTWPDSCKARMLDGLIFDCGTTIRGRRGCHPRHSIAHQYITSRFLSPKICSTSHKTSG
jgi:hypothetical protein